MSHGRPAPTPKNLHQPRSVGVAVPPSDVVLASEGGPWRENNMGKLRVEEFPKCKCEANMHLEQARWDRKQLRLAMLKALDKMERSEPRSTTEAKSILLHSLARNWIP